MKIRSPAGLHYPITVVDLAKKPEDEVKRFSKLFSYTYETTVTEGNKYGDTKQVIKKFPARFESSLDGIVAEWFIKSGSVIRNPGVPLVEIEEPCTHETQFGGLCAICGKDMTEVDYITDERNVNRATVNMTHDNIALLVSQREALRAEEDAKKRLLAAKKLSLIVDLDQTVIHTTCEKTIGEWQADKDNPNYEALKDVKSFQLADDKASNVVGSWYYIKLRPGLKEFLERVSQMYELHIYTMATRAYAQAVARIIDPDRRYFGDRILSRDENGPDQIKTLHRLFPTNTDMVVIIDDRGDIWHWSDNLVRVRVYNFFPGAGDINASFLPKQQELLTSATQAALPIAPAIKDVSEAETAKSFSVAGKPSDSFPPEATNGVLTELEQQLLSMGSVDSPEVLEEQVKEQEKLIISQQTERPLLQKQLLLDQADDAADEEAKAKNGGAQDPEHHKQRHSLLHDDDRELENVEAALRRVHHEFYDLYLRKSAGPQVGRIAELRGEKSPKKRLHEDSVPDIKVLMPKMKRSVLSGVHLVFSGIIPLGIDHQYSDNGLWAKSFGATISTDINKQTTHVIANPERKTTKVKKAARYPHIKIVSGEWLYQCFSKWERVPEDPFIIEVDPAEQGPATSSLEDLEDGPLLSGDDGDIPSSTDEEELEELTQAVQLDMSEEKWQSLGDEFEDFMNETDGSEEDETGSETDSVRSEASTQSTNAPKGKRKRGRRGTASTDGSEAEDSDSSVNSATGSRLQKRRKRVLERVTSLTNVVTADKSSGLPSPETTGPEENPGGEGERNGGGAEEQDEDEDDEFEAEMMAEFERAESEGQE